MSNGSDIAAEIAAAFAEAGVAVGAGPLVAILRKVGSAGPSSPLDESTPASGYTYHELLALDKVYLVKDAKGNLTGTTSRKLSLSAIGVVPEDGDYVALDTTLSDAPSSGTWERIVTVAAKAPAGVVLKYDCDMET